MGFNFSAYFASPMREKKKPSVNCLFYIPIFAQISLSVISLSDRLLIDKNWLWGELNIQKGELCVKGFLAQHLGIGWGHFQQGLGEFG
jgi:hypothetical protein